VGEAFDFELATKCTVMNVVVKLIIANKSVLIVTSHRYQHVDICIEIESAEDNPP